MSADTVIEIHDLYRRFGSVMAVNGISFEIKRGAVVGFIGANGAGKTTTMRIMTTLDIPTGGMAKVCGFDTVNSPGQVRRRVGWMPDAFGVYDNVTVWEYLDFFARAFGYKGADRHRRLMEVMEFTELAPLSARDMSKLSKGQTQRLCLARTLIHDPEVLILDEPAAGLDPKARIEFKQLINLLSRQGKTVFISSHILSELGEMCDSLLFIDQGRLVHHGDAQTLKSGGQNALVEVRVAGSVEPLVAWVRMNPGVKIFETMLNGARLTFENPSEEFAVDTLRRLVRDGIAVLDYHRIERRLEDVFVEMLRQTNGGQSQNPPPLPVNAAPGASVQPPPLPTPPVP
ncbi:ABC transporter ATP-binding protein [Oscillatoria laete-virens NRMC-F 0139]|nr:ABC transporter ATP-binding protein [Oscillatoria laete-virens]MDL5055749.1 ABC transporter ATP-binding protein [Oscillatoria laete-virens NRMC-F 0139]